MRWFMLPVSIGAHVIAAIVVLIVPLAAEVERPAPARLHPMLVTAVAAVPPEVVALAPPRRLAPARSFAAPPSLGPERLTPPDEAPTGDAAPSEAARIDDGVPPGLGREIAPPAPPAVEMRPPSPRVPQRVGQGVREPRKIVDVTPVYPPLALSARVEGAVILEAVINERGAVERVRVLRSAPLLDGAAVDAVSRWRYTPTLLNGMPVAVLMTITINFTLAR